MESNNMHRIRERDNATKPNLVFVAGFGRTGSSAIVDYLREFSELECPDCKELPFLNSLFYILARVKNNKPLDIQKGYHENVFCAQTNCELSTYKRAFLENKFNLFFSQASVPALAYQTRTREILNQLNEPHLNEEAITQLVTEYVLYLVTLFKSPNGNTYILDNAVTAHRLMLFRYLNFERFGQIYLYVIDRDARDQFLDIFSLSDKRVAAKSDHLVRMLKLITVFKGMNRLLGACYFVHFYHNNRRKAYSSSLACLKGNANLKLRYFFYEDFILNKHHIRDAISNDIVSVFFGTKKADIFFNPVESQAYLSIYKNEQRNLAFKYISHFSSKPSKKSIIGTSTQKSLSSKN